MRAWVGVTDRDWFEFLRAQPALDEVNFWQPSARRPFGAIQPGELFLFKLRYPWHAIVGGGMLAWSGTFPYPYVWELFEERNGAASLGEMRARIARLRRGPLDPGAADVGCIVLVQPFFLDDEDWIEAPPDWSKNIVQGKTYDLASFYGQRLLEEVETKARRTTARRIEGPMWGDPALVRRRLGQGAFRTLVTEARIAQTTCDDTFQVEFTWVCNTLPAPQNYDAVSTSGSDAGVTVPESPVAVEPSTWSRIKRIDR